MELPAQQRKQWKKTKKNLSEDEIKSLDEAIVKVEEACKEDSKENIDKAVEELSKIAQPLSDKLFKKEETKEPEKESLVSKFGTFSRFK